jgi:hypothetical protein
MKNKLFLLLVIIAAMGIAVVLSYGKVWAQGQEAPPEPFDQSKCMIPVEFSNFPQDKQAPPAGGSIVGPDAEQNLYTEPPDAVGAPFPRNTFDFDGVDNPSGDQVDALANWRDAFFYQVIHNQADLLVSFQGDPGGVAVWKESWWVGKNTSPLWAQVHLNNPNPAGELEDMDALEVWGPRYDADSVPNPDDANLYSLIGDVGGVSVWCYWPGTGASTPYILHPIIQAAVESLGYVGPTVDLDGLMAFENGSKDSLWDDGDTILFSIRNTKPAGNWDGGEIVVLGWNAVPGTGAHFLDHGGHTWNTAFACSTAFGVHTEEVDAIEAYPPQPQPSTPTLTEWGLIILVVLLIASTVFVLLKRRKAAVPA